MLCKHRHIFGEERKGFHSYRVFDIAIGDFLLTVLLAFGISYVFNVNYYTTLIIIMIIGIIVHRLFCVNTKINTILFGKV